MTQTRVTIDYERACCRCELPIPAGYEAICENYYGKRPADYAHWPNCDTHIDNELKQAGYDPDKVGRKIELVAKAALRRVATQPFYGMRGEE